MTTGTGLKRRLLGTTGIVLAFVINADAAQSKAAKRPNTIGESVAFEIVEQDLNQAVLSFAQRAGVHVLCDSAKLVGKQAKGVTGTLTPREALVTMLADSGLKARWTSASTVKIGYVNEPETTGQITRADARATLDEISVEGAAAVVVSRSSGVRTPGLPPPTGTVGQPPPPYAGGQVASGGRVGFLGNRSVFDTPFTQNNYTEELIRDQQALTISGVFDNNPALRPGSSPFEYGSETIIRGIGLNARDYAFDGLYGITTRFRPQIEGIARVEVLNGPAAFLYGFPPSGSVAGVVNLIPKRAPEFPLTRVTGQYLSNANLGGTFDVARRFGDGNALGVRINGTYRDGPTPVDRNDERFGAFTLGADYRGDRFRLSADFGYQNFNTRAPVAGFGVLPGFAVPRAPRLTSNVQQPWERSEIGHVFAIGRAEYDLTDDITVFAAGGGSTTNTDFILTSPTITDASGTLDQFTLDRIISPQDQWTAEAGIRARFATGFIDHNAAVVGTHYETAQSFANSVGPSFTSNLYRPIFYPRPFIPSERSLPRTRNDINLDGIAVTDTMSVLDGRVQVIAGGRFQRAQQRQKEPTLVVSANYEETAATPLAAMVVKPLTNLSLYASYAEGFGFGPTAPPEAVNAGAVFPPVITSQIETGAKLDLGTLGATVAFYEITQPSAFINPVTRVFSLNGEQRNRGMDVNLFGEPLPGLRVLGGVSLLDGVLTKTEGGTFNNNVAPGVPTVQLNVGGEVDLPPWLIPGLALNGRVIYTTKQFIDLANTQTIPDYARLDLGVRYRFQANGTPLVARFNVLNATGNNYWASGGQGFLVLGTPRTFLFSLQADL